MTTVCRVCLTGGGSVRMKTIAIDDQQMYEQLARVTVNTEVQPLWICYICHSQLLRCRRFSNIAHRSETILTDLRNRNIEATHENIIALNLRITTNLAVSHNHHTIYINASKGNGETKEELFLHEETVVDDKEDVNNMYTCLCKENKLNTGIDLNSETEYKSIKIEGITEYDNQSVDLIATQKNCNLNEDDLYHEPLSAHTCKICFKTFQIQSILDKHIRIHSGEKSYNCVHCDKIFTKKINLTSHIRTHTFDQK